MGVATSKAAGAITGVALLLIFSSASLSSNADTHVADSIATLASVVADSIPLAGHVVYVDFWASWCGPCRASFPWMNALRDKHHKQGLEVVTVNLDSDPAAGRKFLDAMKSSLPVIFDPKGSLAQQYRLEVMPTSFVYGRDGRLKSRHEGFQPRDTAALETLVISLLEEKPPK